MSFAFSKTNLPKQLFINNEYVVSNNSKKFSVYNPKDGSLVADDVALANEQDVDNAVAAAEKAFPAWRSIPTTERRDLLEKFASLIETHQTTLAELSRITLGAPTTIGLYEAGLAKESFKYFAGLINKYPGDSYPQDDGFLKIVRNEPLGVTAGIAAWNGPMFVACSKAAPALATGNCFILKPSEKTPFAALALGALIKEAGFPPGVFQVLSGDGSTGALLTAHMKIRKVSFTGSVLTGKRIQEAAAKSNLKRVTLELGGKSPAVVFDDAHLENAIKWTVQGITGNTGQICVAASRVYVQESIFDKFVEAYKMAFQAATKMVGDPEAQTTGIGPLVDEIQFKRVTGFIERSDKGSLVAGGKRIGNEGYFIEPTIFKNVPESAELVQQEVFGPVVVINTFKTEEEVIALSNDTEYGLAAGVFTQDIQRALRVASLLEAGTVGINNITTTSLGVPFGGFKQSGYGRENSIDALEAYTNKKTILITMKYD
ncbi:aldehyde dehydrogenase X mitochondrial precursor [Tricladium varicosporioides]|nr:aldehyde dehydrogenase X mitochondrial precursor [Hymenoscyphus varicosporioides]